MSEKVNRLLKWNKPGAYGTAEEGATKGATIGENVWNANGTLFVPSSSGSGTTPVSYTFVGQMSVQVQQASGNVVLFQLVNDEVAPYPNWFWYSDSDGVKRWNPLYPTLSNPYATYVVDENGNYVIDENGKFVIAHDGFPIPLQYGGTGADNSTVVQNLVWASPASMPGAPTFRALVLTDLPAPFPALGAGGTTAQFWRGDGTWSQILTGDFTVQGANITLGATGGGTTVTFPRPNASAADSSFQIGSPGGDPGMVGFSGTNSRVDLRFGANQLRVGVSATSATPTLFYDYTATYFAPSSNNTQSLGLTGQRWSSIFGNNVIVGPVTPAFGGAVGAMFVGNATTIPATNPTNGVIIYVEAGSLKVRSPSGTVTVLAPP